MRLKQRMTQAATKKLVAPMVGASRMRLKPGTRPVIRDLVSRSNGWGFSDEIETEDLPISLIDLGSSNGWGFSDEIETSLSTKRNNWKRARSLALSTKKEGEIFEDLAFLFSFLSLALHRDA